MELVDIVHGIDLYYKSLVLSSEGTSEMVNPECPKKLHNRKIDLL